MTDETATRFLAAIAKQIPADRVIEVHLFAAIKQGGMESGVAVIALERELVPSLEVAETNAVDTAESVTPHDQLADEAAFVADELLDEPSPYADAIPVEAVADIPEAPAARAPASRYTIYSARYRYTLKGIDRGKWEVSVTEEAEAPLLTVDAVVRGVQRRSGDADEVRRLSGDEFRAALPTVQLAS